MKEHGRIYIRNSVVVAAGANQLGQKFIPGDIVWTKIHNSMWWPAQVVDEKNFGAKPMRRSEDEILVRLYGSYENSYVDPLRCSIEFENIVKQDNITAKELFQKSLEKEISEVLSDGSSKREHTHVRDATAKYFKRKTRKQRRTAKIGSSTLRTASPEQKEKDDARVTAASNTKTKQYEARKQRINKNCRQENFEGNSTRQGTPANQDVVNIETEGSSGVKSTARHCLRRSLRNISKKYGMEKKKAEYLEFQNVSLIQLGTASPEQEEKDDARVTTASNTNTKQYEARKQRINKNCRQENFEGNSTRQGTPANQDVVDIETEGSSGVKSTAGPEQQEKDYARLTTESNTNAKQYDARKQRINMNYRQENSEGNSTRQGTPANQEVVDIETEGSSGVKSTAGYCLRRSLRNASKKDGMKKNKSEYLKYQNAGTCVSVNLKLTDEVRPGASNIEDMKKLGSAQLRHKVRNTAKEKFLQEISKEKSDNPIEYRTNGGAVTKPEIVRKYTLRKRKQKDTEAESMVNVGLEIPRGESKEKIDLEKLDSADIRLSGDLLCKTIKGNVIQEMNINGPLVRTRNMISKEASRIEIFNHGEAGKQKISKLKVSGAFVGKGVKQSGLRKQKEKDSKKLENIDSSKSGYPASESVEDIKARKLKVMECLGLIAPSGSPFR